MRQVLLPLLALCALDTAGAGLGHAEKAALIRQAEGPHYIFEAADAPISSVLAELRERHGIKIGGSHYVTERNVSGRFEGSLPEILERVFQQESFALFFGGQANAKGTRISRLAFIGRSEGEAAAPPPTPQAQRLGNAEHRRLYHEGLPPPPIPDVVARAIALPPHYTPEREAFDKALAQTAAELEAAVRPLRVLGE